MKNTSLLFSASLVLASLFSGCNPNGSTSAKEPKPSATQDTATALDTLRLALDWRPNVLHSGIFYAQSQGWYQQAGVLLEWFTPEVDGYTKKPLKKVLDGEAHLSVGPSEHLFHYAVDAGKVKAQAIATLLQESRSAFVVKAAKNLGNPAQWTGKTYLGYRTPLEEEVLGSMMEHAGGKANFETQLPGRLELWEAFLQDSGDIAWVFLHWEAIRAQQAGIALDAFIPNDYGVPYGYSSVVMAPKPLPAEWAPKVRKFLAVTRQGYEAVQRQPQAAVDTLLEFVEHPNFRDSSFIQAAQADINSAYFNADSVSWGSMRQATWQNYLDWMAQKKLLDYQKIKGLPAEAFFTNAYLPKE
jgi:NitT/TauT family transport system substrate-binding protein